MHFSFATILGVVPFLVSASPLAEQPHTTIPLSRRSNLYEADSIVDLDSFSEHHASTIAKMKRGFENYERNTGERHPLQPEVAPVVKRNVGNAPLKDVNYLDAPFWFGTMSVGTPPQTLTVQYDTNTADLTVPDWETQCIFTWDNRTRYDPSASSTSVVGRPYKPYEDVLGTTYKDTVKIAGFTSTNQTFLTKLYCPTVYWGDNKVNYPSDGIMGMGFRETSNLNMPSVFDNLVSQGQLTNSVFALKLTSRHGELNIGGLNSALYTGTPTYTPISIRGFWSTQFDSITVGKTTVVDSRLATLDSTSALTHGPIDDVIKFYAKIPGAQMLPRPLRIAGPELYHFVIPCVALWPPHITFTIGGKDFRMSHSSLRAGKNPNGGGCLGSIVGEEEGNLWILGERWMSNFYTIFDAENSRVGFADLA